jgi:transcriptional regulator with XRE-family HTH domain
MWTCRSNSEKLRFELLRRSWTPSDLAAQSGVSRPTISAALRGRPIQPRTIKLIAAALGTSPVTEAIDDLF